MAEGQVLAGKYRVERVLGEGGMGVVVAARHIHLQERVALKFMLLEVKKHSDAVARFLREAQAAVKIKSEHVARVTDFGTLDQGTPFMVMEYLDGEDLEAHLVRHGPLEPSIAVGYVLQACVAIAEAHRVGIVHRDLKPSNLFLTERSDGTPCIKVLDFGISKVQGDVVITRTTGQIGTPAYMSPEQLRASRDVDARADIWSLGVILFELTSGRLPYHADSFAELCAEILSAAPRSLHAVAPHVSEELDAVVARCMQKHPADRYPSVAALARALAPLAHADMRDAVDRITRIGRGSLPDDPPPTTARTQTPSRSPALDPTALATPVAAEERPPVRRSWGLIVTLGTLASVVALWAAWGSSPTPQRVDESMTPRIEIEAPPTPSAEAPAVIPEPTPPARASAPVLPPPRPVKSLPPKPPPPPPPKDDFGGRK